MHEEPAEVTMWLVHNSPCVTPLDLTMFLTDFDIAQMHAMAFVPGNTKISNQFTLGEISQIL